MSSDRSPGEWNLAVRQQAAIARLGQLGLRSGDLEEVLREAMVIAAETLELRDVALFELHAPEAHLRGRAGIYEGQVHGRRAFSRLTVPTGPGSLPGYVADADEVVASGDLRHDHRFHAAVIDRGLDLRAAIGAPVGWDGDVWGVFAVYDAAVREWTDDEVQFVQAIANTMALAIQRSRIETALRDSSTRLDISLSAGGLGAWSWDVEHNDVVLNTSALAMYGLTSQGFGGDEQSFLALIHPDDRALFAPWTEDLRGHPEQHLTFRIIRPDNGEVRWIESWGRLLDDEASPLHVVGVCSDVTERRRDERRQQEILASEHAARVAAETARERLSFLAEASEVLSASLDPSVTLQSLGELCVPRLADVCFIDLVDEEGSFVEHVGLASAEVKLHDARALRRRRRELGEDAPTATGHVQALTGRGHVYHSIDDAQLVGAAADPDHLALFRRFDARSTIISPLVARGRTIGVLTLVRTGDATLFDPEDLAFVEDLAARAALATDNGRLYDSRNRVARSLQEALLPPALPRIRGLALAARYDVAEADVAIGGDFYDVIPVAPNVWGVVVGDVCGRGPDAAALTGLVRHTLRSAVVRELIPSRVLRQTNEAMLQQIDDARFCTAAYLAVEVVDAERGQVRVAASSAGHPRPVLVRADGRAELLPCAGTLLGVVDDPELNDTTVELGPLDAIVLYTDGVTEARRGNDQFGEGRLVRALGELAGMPAEQLAGGLDRAVAEHRRSARDDTAILVLQAAPSA